MNVTDEISSYIKWRYYTMYDTFKCVIPPFDVIWDLVCNIHGVVIYISYYDGIQPEDGFYSRNMLLMVNYKQSCVQILLFFV